MKTVKRNNILEFTADNLFWLIGCISYSAGVTVFAVPNNIAQSGMTGIAVVLNYLFNTPVGITNFILNVPLFILAFIFIGKRFTYKTLWVTAILSASMDFMSFLVSEGIIPSYIKGDRLLAAVFCGLFCGFGLAMIFLRNATSGGTDIIMRLIRRRFPHVSVGRMILIVDAVVIFSSAAVFRSIESALYAVIQIIISSALIDRILYGASSGKMLLIFTEKANDITKVITENLHRGVSIVPIVGGYTGERKSMLIAVLRGYEVSYVRRLIKEIDDNTFIVIAEAGEILGEGFRPPPY